MAAVEVYFCGGVFWGGGAGGGGNVSGMCHLTCSLRRFKPAILFSTADRRTS